MLGRPPVNAGLGRWPRRVRARRGSSRCARGICPPGHAEQEALLGCLPLAKAYEQSGQAEAGLRVLAEALAVVDTTGDRRWEAELHRFKGELLLQQVVPDAAQPEAVSSRPLPWRAVSRPNPGSCALL